MPDLIARIAQSIRPDEEVGLQLQLARLRSHGTPNVVVPLLLPSSLYLYRHLFPPSGTHKESDALDMLVRAAHIVEDSPVI